MKLSCIFDYHEFETIKTELTPVKNGFGNIVQVKWFTDKCKFCQKVKVHSNETTII